MDQKKLAERCLEKLEHVKAQEPDSEIAIRAVAEKILMYEGNRPSIVAAKARACTWQVIINLSIKAGQRTATDNDWSDCFSKLRFWRLKLN